MFDAAIIARFNLLLAQETEDRALALDRVTRGVKALLGDPAKGTYYLAEADGVIVGQLLITTEWSDWRNGTFWWLQSVFVDPPFRRRGIFQALFLHVQQRAAGHEEVCGLRLYMDSRNARARRVYEQLGMKHTGYEVFEVDYRAAPQVRTDAFISQSYRESMATGMSVKEPVNPGLPGIPPQ